jgi:hypothetical protein
MTKLKDYLSVLKNIKTYNNWFCLSFFTILSIFWVWINIKFLLFLIFTKL